MLQKTWLAMAMTAAFTLTGCGGGGGGGGEDPTPSCAVYEQPVGGKCVEKTCADGTTLNKTTGACDANPVTPPTCEVYEQIVGGKCVDKVCADGTTLNKATGTCDTTPTPSKTEYRVTVVDGYLHNAYVWLDCDNDGVRDSDEAQALTNNSGVATIDVSKVTNPESCPIGGYAKANFTTDIDNSSSKIASDFTLWAPAGSVVNNAAVISPLTTLVLFQMQQGSNAAMAKAEVAGMLGIPEAQIGSDFIAGNQYATGAIAANLVQVLPKLDLHGSGGWGGALVNNIVTDVADAVRKEYKAQSAATGADRRKGISVVVDSAGNVGEATYKGPGANSGESCLVYQQQVNGKCVDKTCADGTVLNKTTGNCDVLPPTCPVYQQVVGGQCVDKVCADGTTLNKTTGACDANSEGPTCEVYQDVVGDKCVDKVCDTGFTLNKTTGKCDADGPKCTDSQELIGGTCLDKCGEGEVRDESGKCVTDNVECEIE